MPQSDDKIEEKEDWLNEHGQPDFEYLQSLAVDRSPEALEKLKSVAEDLNVEYDVNTSPEELVERIRSAIDQNDDDGSDVTT
jgi:sugar/nucleoside kinase (ribokinase family)